MVPNRDSASPRPLCVALHAADPQYHGQRESKGTHRTQPDAGTRPAWSERTVSPSATFALRENGEGCHPTWVTGQMTPAYAKESTLSVANQVHVCCNSTHAMDVQQPRRLIRCRPSAGDLRPGAGSSGLATHRPLSSSRPLAC